jgi:hypothetical protein
MREPLIFPLHRDGAHDPTIVRAIATAAQAAYELTHRRQIEDIILQNAEQLSHESSKPASARHWLAACGAARSQYARSRALAADPLEPDRKNSRRFVRLLVKEQKRYDLPSITGLPYDGATVGDGFRSVVAQFLPYSTRIFHPPPRAYVDNVIVETAQLAVAFHDDTFLKLAQEHFFDLGVWWKTRARLAEYLHPYGTGNRSVTPEKRLAKILNAADPALYVRQSYADRFHLRHHSKGIKLGGQPVLRLDGLPEIVASVTELLEARKGFRIDTGMALMAVGFDLPEIKFMKLINLECLNAREAGAAMGFDAKQTEAIRQRCHRKSRRLRNAAHDNTLIKMGNSDVGFVRTTRDGRVLWQPGRV